jgi:glycosyltransferase involved in cell wall biosynthesis
MNSTPSLKMSAAPGGRVVVAIPARNEADELGGCLEALGAQQEATPDAVVVCLNNCTDASASVVREIAPSLPFVVEALEVRLPRERATAGFARRMAMDRAAELAGPAGVVLTTDADGRVAEDWLAGNLAALATGVDAVAGQADIEPHGARLIPAHLHAIDARECAYAALVDEIYALVDPDPYDPWPRHDEHSGASIAVTVEAYRRAGGLPPVALAEDRALFAALRMVDARIRHAIGVRVVVSARTVGRAAGGMADTIRRRIAKVDDLLDDRLEPAADSLRRARLRARLRQARTETRGGGERESALAVAFGLTVARTRELLAMPFLGAAWQAAEAESPVLARRRVALADLSLELAQARRMRDGLRLDATRAEDRAGSQLRAAVG